MQPRECNVFEDKINRKLSEASDSSVPSAAKDLSTEPRRAVVKKRNWRRLIYKPSSAADGFCKSSTHPSVAVLD
jgi:hypothetical protein